MSYPQPNAGFVRTVHYDAALSAAESEYTRLVEFAKTGLSLEQAISFPSQYRGGNIRPAFHWFLAAGTEPVEGITFFDRSKIGKGIIICEYLYHEDNKLVIRLRNTRSGSHLNFTIEFELSDIGTTDLVILTNAMRKFRSGR